MNVAAFTSRRSRAVERRDHHALAIEYRLNHISNNFTALTNPGIDSNLLRVAYSFGR